MTHPITPPPELVQQWISQFWSDGKPSLLGESDMDLSIRAAQWGADQELEACCEWLESEPDPGHVDLLRSCATALRTVRRPKPPSLKEQALADLAAAYNDDKIDGTTYEIIRRALEQLDD